MQFSSSIAFYMVSLRKRRKSTTTTFFLDQYSMMMANGYVHDDGGMPFCSVLTPSSCLFGWCVYFTGENCVVGVNSESD